MLKNIRGCMLTFCVECLTSDMLELLSILHEKVKYFRLSVTDKSNENVSLYSATYGEINHDPVCKTVF
jgi:hypothetical protein